MTQWTSARERRFPTTSVWTSYKSPDFQLTLRIHETDLTVNYLGDTTPTHDTEIEIIKQGMKEPRQMTLCGRPTSVFLIRCGSGVYIDISLLKREYRSAGSNATGDMVYRYVVDIANGVCWEWKDSGIFKWCRATNHDIPNDIERYLLGYQLRYETDKKAIHPWLGKSGFWFDFLCLILDFPETMKRVFLFPFQVIGLPFRVIRRKVQDLRFNALSKKFTREELKQAADPKAANGSDALA